MLVKQARVKDVMQTSFPTRARLWLSALDRTSDIGVLTTRPQFISALAWPFASTSTVGTDDGTGAIRADNGTSCVGRFVSILDVTTQQTILITAGKSD